MSYEIREDEEQEVKFQEITELLVGAGYFRARIKGLAPFDKVVGGLTWCILNCAVDIDVDLLYHENSSIGKKIALTEKIVAVLPKMKCPHRIEPHQIQGLDFINIFPVVQWLVKKALETRAEREVFNRSYTMREFEKLSNNKLENRTVSSIVKEANEENRPRRKLQPLKPFTDKESSVRVMLTLLEYKDRNMKLNQDETDGENEDQEESIRDMTEKKNKIRIDANAISDILSKRNEELKDATNEYLEMIKNEEKKKEETSSSIAVTIENMKIKQDNLEKKLDAITNEEQKEVDKKETLEKEIDESEANFIGIFESIQSSTPQQHQELLAKMKKLISMNEKLKKNDSDFRLNCKNELDELQARNEEALAHYQKVAAEDESSNAGNEMKMELNSKRKKLAEQSRLCLELERKIDRIPSRSELAQYQRRFVELYGQMDSTQNETQHFFDMYNNLGQQLAAIEKEIQLMNSIQETFVTISVQKHNKYEVQTSLPYFGVKLRKK